MPVSVFYLAIEQQVSMEIRGGQHIFRFSVPESRTPAWDFYSSDAYHLRDLFDGAKSPQQAFEFLGKAGCFKFPRCAGAGNVLTWNEFQNWQWLVRHLRLRKGSEGFPVLPLYDDEFREKFIASEFLANESSEAREQFWNVSEDTYRWFQGIPSGLMISRDMYLSYEQIRGIFSAPGADIPGSKAWHDAQAALARRRSEKADGNKEGKQRLYAEICVGSALDAILATVYIDSLRGIETQVCALNDCEDIFEVTSQHGKKYCSNYHAHLASVRRSRRKAKQRRNPRIRKGKGQ